MSFEPLSKTCNWAGHYGRIPGKDPAFHVTFRNGVHKVYLEWKVDDERARCPMLDTSECRRLGSAVWRAKGSSGGSFLIDEFGRVLVPTRTHRVFVGYWSGPLWFQDSYDNGKEFDLTDPKGYEPGSPWYRPYVGNKYYIDDYGLVKYQHEIDHSKDWVYGPELEPSFLASFRAIRRRGTGRVLAVPGGLILTKCEPDWTPTYVGRINFSYWFSREGAANA